jgi:hypothetical protein
MRTAGGFAPRFAFQLLEGEPEQIRRRHEGEVGTGREEDVTDAGAGGFVDEDLLEVSGAQRLVNVTGGHLWRDRRERSDDQWRVAPMLTQSIGLRPAPLRRYINTSPPMKIMIMVVNQYFRHGRAVAGLRRSLYQVSASAMNPPKRPHENASTPLTSDTSLVMR